VKLVDARELARAAHNRVSRGGDPVAEKRAARDKKSWQEDKRQLDADLTPKWKARPAGEISAEDLLAGSTRRSARDRRQRRIDSAPSCRACSHSGWSRGSWRRPRIQ
jgi:hypothetical protein